MAPFGRIFSVSCDTLSWSTRDNNGNYTKSCLSGRSRRWSGSGVAELHTSRELWCSLPDSRQKPPQIRLPSAGGSCSDQPVAFLQDVPVTSCKLAEVQLTKACAYDPTTASTGVDSVDYKFLGAHAVAKKNLYAGASEARTGTNCGASDCVFEEVGGGFSILLVMFSFILHSWCTFISGPTIPTS